MNSEIDSSKNIITRFPPSPSGFLHVGNARTAIFNWLYTRHMKGKLVLRIEDTDQDRSSQASIDAILEALEWLGIDWDEGPFFQSKRLEIYQDHIKRLIESGDAYYCTCTPDKLDAMRKEAVAAGNNPKYDGRCREKGLPESDDTVVRFKAPLAGTTILEDIIKDNIVFQNTELDDFIIRRSNCMPTYNLAVVVDDITMSINTVIRGDDHVNNTPKQILLFKALGAPLPDFGHLPMVLGNDRSRLSKRHGAMSTTAYRDMGYLPDAVMNYLVRLGWSHGDQEFFTRDELIEKFTLENIGHSAGVFDPDKLLALNADHIKATSPADLVAHLLPFLEKRECRINGGPDIEKVIETLQVRSKTLEEMADGALFYYAETIVYDEKAAGKFLKATLLEPVVLLLKALDALEEFTQEKLEGVFLSVMEETGLKLGKIAQPVRVALTGGTVSPGIFEIIAVLGKERVVSRLQKAVQFIENREES